jgi:two-component system, NarL family, response regulator
MKKSPSAKAATTRRKTAVAKKAPSPTIRIVLADDHHVVRQGMAAIIGTEPDLKIVGEACDGEQALAFYAKFKPDVLVLDLRMPVLDGFEVVKRLIATDPDARILVMTTYDTDEDIWRCLRAGAKGYLLKDALQPEIVTAIRTVARGESFTTPLLAVKLAHRATTPELTSREFDVLQLLAAGNTNKEIAAALKVEAGTIKTHLKALFTKIGATTRTEAVHKAEERGLLRPK